MHGWPAVTAQTLPELIAELRSAGAEFTTVDELV
jgi:hypothetical protein